MPGFLVALITGIHILACVALMVTILLQSGKGGGLAGAFGGGSSQTLFGGRGAASFLSRASTVLAIIFFVTSLTLGLAASRGTTARMSLIQEEARKRASQRAATGQPTGAPATGQPGGQPGGMTVPPSSPANTPPATTPQQNPATPTTPAPTGK